MATRKAVVKAAKKTAAKTAAKTARKSPGKRPAKAAAAHIEAAQPDPDPRLPPEQAQFAYACTG